ncbi:MAG TPA: DEAD/DEAH box helicase [Candidatus Acidoferrales bacterium]|nr:DEAD/DEAH box helicase [Candidatus Acidoferrales bacterium]
MLENTFEQLHKPIRAHLEKIGLEEPSDIQRIAIPPILEGCNVLVIAPTGTGKTLASILPIFNMFLEKRSANETKGISILYITPLRALNRDILRRLTEIGKELDIKVQVRHGDTPTSTRAAQARSPPEMLVTTPETLQAILPGRRMREHLKGVRWVVIDEVHELATDERGVQLSIALERLGYLTGRAFQRIGLSATVGEEDKVGKFLAGTERAVTVAKSEELRKVEIHLEYVQPTAEDAKDAEKFGLPQTTIARAKRIGDLIAEKKSTLVFTNTREQAEAVGSQLHALRSSLPVRVHHGSLSREIREEVEKAFHDGSLKGVICTSSLELGMDIGRVEFIVQYMSPRMSTRLIQRVGRSGHTLRGLARGVVIGAWADDLLEAAVLANNAKASRIEKTIIHDKALDVLGHQIAGIALDLRRAKLEDVYRIVQGSYPFRDLTGEELHEFVKFLSSIGIVRLIDDVISPRFPRAFHYYYENLSVIPDVKRFDVFDFLRKRRIGTLDQGFVARKCKGGTIFIIHGQTWKIINVNEEKLTVEVEPTAPTLDAIPSWEGEIIPVSFDTAQEVGRLRAYLSSNLQPAELNALKQQHNLNDEALTKIIETVTAQTKYSPPPSNTHIVIEKFENCIIIHACFGSTVNDTFAMILASMLGAKYGVNVATQTDPYRIALICPFKIEPETVALELSKFTPDDVEKILVESLQNSDLFAWRHWHVARRFGIIERKADYKTNRARMLVRAMKGSPVNVEAQREVLLEKFDLATTKEIVAKMHEGLITVDIVTGKADTCSPYAAPIIDKIIPHDLLRPAVPSKPLTDVVRERLNSETVRLVCMFNGDWDAVRVVDQLGQKIQCPKCGSTLIAATYLGNDLLLSAVKKKKRNLKLTPEEEHDWKQGYHSASLVQTKGKEAIIVLSGRGVGPATATRILRRVHRSQEDLYLDILKAEREYARTRLFWD